MLTHSQMQEIDGELTQSQMQEIDGEPLQIFEEQEQEQDVEVKDFFLGKLLLFVFCFACLLLNQKTAS